ncbi:hypothetical protein ADJ73_09595 [Arsenicicoccus sp. oral taxon 190]|nr:hypothetical protein ADJ73_09595 [Arsenicicoccus sp. oral taxon 190]
MATSRASKQAARERAAALRAQQQAAERRRRVLLAAVTSLVVLAIVGAVVAVALLNRGKPSPAAASAARLDAASLAALNDVPEQTLQSAGAGDTTNGPTRAKDATAVTKDGKPQVLYVGAEYCPYCAGLRWSTAVALGRFGQWTSLTEGRSVKEPGLEPLATVSFSQQNHGAAYTSDTVAFTGYETTTSESKNGRYVPLDTLDGADKKLFETYDFPPYTDERSKGAIPFVSIGGKTFQHGGLMDIKLLEGKSAQQIAGSLKAGTDPAAKAILEGANVLTAAICEQTGGKPADVCSSKAVKDAAGKIKDK